MYISKKDALSWFEFFAQLPEDEPLMPRQQEIALATLSQIEAAEEARIEALRAQIPGLKSLNGRSFYVGDDARFPKGCRSCLLGTGLSAVRKTNSCNLRCRFCYDYGEMDLQPPMGEGYWEIGGTRFREEDIDLLLSIHKKPTGIAYVYLEPFMEIEKYYGVIAQIPRGGRLPAHVHQRHPGHGGKPAGPGRGGAGRAALQPGGQRLRRHGDRGHRHRQKAHPHGGHRDAHDPRAVRGLPWRRRTRSSPPGWTS